MKRKNDRSGNRRASRDFPAWRMRDDAPVTIYAPVGLDDVHFNDDPTVVGESAAAMARVVNELLDQAREQGASRKAPRKL